MSNRTSSPVEIEVIDDDIADISIIQTNDNKPKSDFLKLTPGSDSSIIILDSPVSTQPTLRRNPSKTSTEFRLSPKIPSVSSTIDSFPDELPPDNLADFGFALDDDFDGDLYRCSQENEDFDPPFDSVQADVIANDSPVDISTELPPIESIKIRSPKKSTKYVRLASESPEPLGKPGRISFSRFGVSPAKDDGFSDLVNRFRKSVSPPGSRLPFRSAAAFARSPSETPKRKKASNRTKDDFPDDALDGKAVKIAAKEREKIEKQKAKELKEKEKLEKKLQKETEKLEKAAFKEARKPIQGGKSSLECLRMELPKRMLEALGRDEILTFIKDECELINSIEMDHEGEDALVVRWWRSHVRAEVQKTDTSVSLAKSEERLEESDLLIQIPKKHFIAMVDFHKQTRNGVVIDDVDRDSINSFINRHQRRFPGKRFTYFVHGLDAYFRKQINEELHGDARPNRSKPPRRSLLEIPYKITHQDIEWALIDVSCRFGIRVVLLDTAREFARLLLTTHKAIAEKTFKELRERSLEGFDSISANVKTKGVAFNEDDRESYRELWIRQLEQFSLVSRDIAITIAQLYPSPRALAEAYDRCVDEKAKERLIENVVVKRGTERRIGPKMSKLMYKFMNSWDGNEILE